MVSLSPEDQSRVRFHLGYATMDGIADGDAIRLETEMNRIRDNTQLNYLRFILDSLDDFFTKLMLGETYDSRQLITGDISRATIVDTPSDFRAWQEVYFKKCDELARQLNVASYARPEQARYRFQRLGSVSVFPAFGHPLGPADTTVGGKIEFSANYA